MNELERTAFIVVRHELLLECDQADIREELVHGAAELELLDPGQIRTDDDTVRVV